MVCMVYKLEVTSTSLQNGCVTSSQVPLLTRHHTLVSITVFSWTLAHVYVTHASYIIPQTAVLICDNIKQPMRQTRYMSRCVIWCCTCIAREENYIKYYFNPHAAAFGTKLYWNISLQSMSNQLRKSNFVKILRNEVITQKYSHFHI